MTQRPTPIRPLRNRKQLLRRLGCLSSLGVFSSGITLAQAAPTTSLQTSVTASPSPVVVAPTAADLTPTASASSPTTPAPAAPEKEAPDPAPPVEIEIPQSSPVSESPLVKPQAAPENPAPNYVPPSSIVIEKRDSAPKVTTVKPKTTGIANAVSKAISGVIRPKFNPAQPEAEAEAEAPSTETASSWAPPSIVPPSFVQDYFNRTVRPLGLPGNGDVRLLFPLSIPSAITSVFGWRVHPITGDQRLHTGTDLGAPMGTPVLAALTGRVIMADFFGGYGLAIALEHTNGSQQTLYAHLSEIFVKPGDVVKQGTVIGRVGSTGNSTGPHLHFEFRQQTPEGGWVAQDAGASLEQSVAQLVKSMQVTQQNPQNPGS
ncbi:M23 family metallopeptidase [Leptolyngbya sp. FACHB-17]|uniref:M23 family metallopeptidase n=1 Tax=unclassified Leptolyngbya TaxID=2650499 RepID=UPI0018EF7111|nr:M23 family metallopeptidase [Leptolyngbya sp. FACHB-17]